MSEEKKIQSKTTMMLVALFFGTLGAHRFLMGYENWWMQLLTGGGCGIWALMDAYNIYTGKMKMADGRDLI